MLGFWQSLPPTAMLIFCGDAWPMGGLPVEAIEVGFDRDLGLILGFWRAATKPAGAGIFRVSWNQRGSVTLGAESEYLQIL
jgi:hypothetical protein